MINAKRANNHVHTLPADLRKQLRAHPVAMKTWNEITPLARNEWICWIESTKRADTRTRRVTRASEELMQGKRRPCCWPGCSHRTPNRPI